MYLVVIEVSVEQRGQKADCVILKKMQIERGKCKQANMSSASRNSEE